MTIVALGCSTVQLVGPAAGASDRPLGTLHRVVALWSNHEAFTEPAQDSSAVGLITAKRALTAEQTVLPVLGTRTVAYGQKWLNVMIPGRPNGRTGWVRALNTRSSSTPYEITVHLRTREVRIYKGNDLARATTAVVGKSSTPTPLGHFFVEEVVRLPPSAVGAPYAYALSARSNVLQEFAGGPGQIALHGLKNIGGTLGTAVSHGCVRLDVATLDWMVSRIGPGVRVDITN